MRRWIWCMGLVSGACTAPNGDYKPEAASTQGTMDSGSSGSLGGTLGGPTTGAETSGTSGDPPLDSSDGGSDTTEGVGETEGPGEWVFEQVELVEELSMDTPETATREEDPTLRQSDMLEMYFSSNHSGNFDIYRATRETVEDPWAVSEGFPHPYNDPVANDNSPELSHDGLWMTFSSDRNDSYDIFIVERTDPTADWDNLRPLEGLNNGMVLDSSAVLTGDNNRALFCSMRIPPEDIYEATRANMNEMFMLGDPLGKTVNTNLLDCTPWIDAPGLLMLFATSRYDEDGDLVATERLSLEDPFDSVTPLGGGINTADGEFDPWLSSDRSVLYFSRRNYGTDNADIYRAVRVMN